jgi:hypothetical protein
MTTFETGALTAAVAIVSSIVTTWVTHLFSLSRKKKEEDSVANYIALRLAILFEDYAIESANKICDHQLVTSSDRTAGKFICEVPMPPPLMLEKEYKLIDLKLLNDILDFPQRCLLANDNAFFLEKMVGDRECTTIALGENTIDMAYRALELGKRLRCQYKLSSRELSYQDYDIEKFLKSEFNKLTATRKTREAQEDEGWSQ